MRIKNLNILSKSIKMALFSAFLLLTLSNSFAQDFWAQQNGPYGGSALTIIADSNGTIYSGTQYGGLQISEDFGTTWAQAGWFGSVRAMILSKNGDLYIPGYNSVAKSVDGGVSFETYSEGLSDRFTASSFAENLAGDIFVSSDSGLYVSRDEGSTWSSINSDLPSKTIRRVFVSSDNHIYVNVYGTGVYRSLDDGVNWQNISDGLPAGFHMFTDFAENSNKIIYNSVSGSGVFALAKGSTLWQNINTGLTDLSVFALAINTNDNIFCGTYSGGVFRFITGSWSNVNNGLLNTNIQDISIDKKTDKIYLATQHQNGGGVYTSINNGDSWREANQGYRGVRAWDLAVNPTNNHIFAGSYYNGVYRSINGGASWEAVSTGLTESQSTYVRTIASSPTGDLYIATSGGGGAYKSADNGENWVKIAPDGLGEFYQAVAVRKNDGAVFLGGHAESAAVVYSTDEGNTWNDISNNITSLSVRAIDFNANGEIYVSTNGGGIYKFEESGQNWNKISNSTLDGLDIYELSVSPTGAIFVGAWAQGAYKSEDEENWNVISDLGTQSLDFVYDSRGTIYAGSYEPKRSKDGGNTWQSIGSGMGATVMECYVVDMDNFVYAGTTKGVYKTVEPSGAVKVHFEVKMKYQDGFNPTSQNVVVRGTFNNWGESGDLILEPLNDPDMTYVGDWVTINPEEAIVDGNIFYKYVIPGEQDIWEVLIGDRFAAWDGQEDLILEYSWFDDQYDFTRMSTFKITLDTAASRGLAWGDYDNDNDPDLYVANWGQPDFLYENKGAGQWNRKDIGLSTEDSSFCVAWGDFDNDNDLDLFITELGGQSNSRLENIGGGNFTKITSGPEVSEGGNTFSVLWLDIDNDSYLDIFAANYYGENNFLYRNTGDGSFEKINTGEIVTDGGNSRGASAADIDNDGDLDIFVANYGEEAGENNFLYINQGDGTFVPASADNPVVKDVSPSGNGCWGDFDNDGLVDLYVANGNYQPNMLYRNLGEGVFKKVTGSIVSTDSTHSRTASWIDINNDGWLDLFVVNYLGSNNLYINNANGNFALYGGGPLLHDLFSNRGAAWADYDRDGDIDVVMNGWNNKPNFIYRNNLEALETNSWVAFKLTGTISNNAAIGAKVGVKANIGGAPVWQYREITSQTGLHSQDEMVAHFGLGNAASIDSVFVVWPGGRKQEITPPPINKRILVVEDSPEYPKPVLASPEDGAVDIVRHPEFKWHPVDGVLSYNLQLSGQSDFSELILNVPDLSDTTYQLNPDGMPLLAVTTHFWRVTAIMDDQGNGNTSDIWNFTTMRGTTYEQVLKVVFPQDSAENVPIEPTLAWTWIDTPPLGADITYDVQLSTASDFTESLLEIKDISEASFTPDYPLEYNRTYFWRVRAKTAATVYVWSDPAWTFRTIPFTGTVNLLYPGNGSTNISIPTPFMWTKIPADGYKIQISTSTDFDNQQNLVYDFNSTPDDTLVFIPESMEYKANSQYYWRVGVISGGVVPADNWTIPYYFETFDNKLDTDFFLTFPEHERADEYTARDYVLVGIPGNSQKHFDEIFTGVRGQDWMAYWDNGTLNPSSPDDFLVPHSVSSTFTFVTGRAFWVINKGDIHINESDLGAVPLEDEAEAHIHVHHGYNLITCPFAEGVDWNQVKILNNLPFNTPLYEFDNGQGRFIMSSSLEVGTGYYFINVDAENNALASPLRIPFNPIYSLPKVVSENNFDWQLKLDLQSGNTGDGTSIIGVNKKSNIGYDQLEYNKPRIMQGIASVYFEHPEWNENFPIFGSDIRPEIDEVETWSMKVYVPDAEKSKLSFTRIEDIPGEYKVALIDKKAARAQDLRENEVYHFKPTAEITEFEIMVGESNIIQERIAQIVPHDFALGQNYPNPFNPTTTIPLALPKAAQIKVTVYNILGKVIKNVYNGVAEPGRHYFQWDGVDNSGKHVASGLYFYRVDIEGREGFTKKMVFMK